MNRLAYLWSGKYLDKTYRLTVEKLSRDRPEPVHNESADFPIEKTRLKGIYVLITVSALGTVGYGVALMTKTVNPNTTATSRNICADHYQAYISNAHYAISHGNDHC